MSNADRKFRMGLKADYEGVMDFVVPKNTIKDNDFIIPYTKYLSGVQLILNNHVFRDQVWLQVVVDIAGVPTVIDQFGEHWYVDSGRQGQEIWVPDNVQSKLDPNGLPSGLTNLRIRVRYKSIGLTNDVDVLVNMIFDIKA